MGRKTYLTVRKRRCNERQDIDSRKKKMCERPPVLRMYGIQDNTGHLPTTSDDPAGTGTVPVNVDSPSTKPINDDPAGTGTVPVNVDSPSTKPINDDPAGTVVDDDPPDFTPINDDPTGTVPVNDDSPCAILISVDLCSNEESDSCSLSPIGNPKVSTETELSGINQVDQYHESLVNGIDLIPSTEVSIDLPPLEWTFLTEPEINVEEMGVDDNQQYIGSVPYENLNELVFQIQFPQPINGWFIIPSSFQNSFIQLCTCSVNTAGSPVIEYTVEIHCTLEWILRLPRGVLEWKCHPHLQALPVYLKSRKDVEEVTDAINDCRQCKGINDPKFHVLTIKHKGRFMDRSGKFTLMFCMCVNAYSVCVCVCVHACVCIKYIFVLVGYVCMYDHVQGIRLLPIMMSRFLQ